ncbi:MAG: TetR/AcrR family transcriptional regulator [Sphingomonadaceae bacterium]|nr:TetR/AcrR family transcriptional regulator [Sphingomonadaceae bacterium]
MKTRDRIVATALNLFNEAGYGAVTTALLAERLGMAEGNLWYHFKTKRALLDAIGERFAASITARLALVPTSDPVASYARLLRAMMAEFRDFRFLYRDQPAYGDHAAVIAQNAPHWTRQTFAQIEAHLGALVDAGLLDLPRERLRDLASNATILLRYGLEHQRELGTATASGTGAVHRTLLRHLTLFEHALAPAAAADLKAAIERIEAEAPLAA